MAIRPPNTLTNISANVVVARRGGPAAGSVAGMVALLLVAASLGLSNFAAAAGIGVSGVDGRTRLRVGIVFGVFETAMPLVGLLLGRGLAGTLGRAAHWIGAGLLIVTGIYALVQAARSPGGHQSGDQAGSAGQRTGR